LRLALIVFPIANEKEKHCDTEGCIRLNNDDLEKLVKQVRIGDVVVITPSKLDVNVE